MSKRKARKKVRTQRDNRYERKRANRHKLALVKGAYVLKTIAA